MSREDFPVFWESASGATIVDVDGNRYIDLTSAFGVANVGHANPARTLRPLRNKPGGSCTAWATFIRREVRTQLLERLATILPSGLTKTFLATTGSEAVEAAIKTAVLATGKISFHRLQRRVSRPVARRADGLRHREIPRTVRAARSRCSALSRLSARWHRRRRWRSCRITGTRRRRPRHRGGHHRADSRARRVRRSAAGIPRRLTRILRRARHSVDLRRDLHRLRTNRRLVCVRGRRRHAGYHLHRQSDGRRVSYQCRGCARERHERMAALRRRSVAHLDVSRESRWAALRRSQPSANCKTGSCRNALAIWAPHWARVLQRCKNATTSLRRAVADSCGVFNCAAPNTRNASSSERCSKASSCCRPARPATCFRSPHRSSSASGNSIARSIFWKRSCERLSHRHQRRRLRRKSSSARARCSSALRSRRARFTELGG